MSKQEEPFVVRMPAGLRKKLTISGNNITIGEGNVSHGMFMTEDDMKRLYNYLAGRFDAKVSEAAIDTSKITTQKIARVAVERTHIEGTANGVNINTRHVNAPIYWNVTEGGAFTVPLRFKGEVASLGKRPFVYDFEVGLRVMVSGIYRYAGCFGVGIETIKGYIGMVEVDLKETWETSLTFTTGTKYVITTDSLRNIDVITDDHRNSFDLKAVVTLVLDGVT